MSSTGGYIIPIKDMPVMDDEATAQLYARLVREHGSVHGESASYLFRRCDDYFWVRTRIAELLHIEGYGPQQESL